MVQQDIDNDFYFHRDCNIDNHFVHHFLNDICRDFNGDIDVDAELSPGARDELPQSSTSSRATVDNSGHRAERMLGGPLTSPSCLCGDGLSGRDQGRIRLPFGQPRPRHARILGRDGHQGFAEAAPLLHRHCPAAQLIGLAF